VLTRPVPEADVLVPMQVIGDQILAGNLKGYIPRIKIEYKDNVLYQNG